MEQKSKVLVVEDDAGIRQSLFETLGALGFAIGEACNGEEALLRLRMVNYDAVLLDINMPGIGGKETCRRICHGYPRLPIIMLTVRDDENDKVEVLDAGAYDYVTKPFQIHELAARLRAVIRRYNSSSQTNAVSVSGGHHSGLRTPLGAKAGRGYSPCSKTIRDVVLLDGACRSPGSSRTPAGLCMGTALWQRA